MNSQTAMNTITVPARDLAIGDLINGARVTGIDATQWGTVAKWGTVAVWISDPVRDPADMIFNHGDPVRITRG